MLSQMEKSRILYSIRKLENSYNLLKEALEITSHSELMIDGILRRFKLTIELFWKTLKRLLAHHGIETNTPRETLKKAYAAN